MAGIGGLSLCCGLNQLSQHSIGKLSIVQKTQQQSNPFEVTDEDYSVVFESGVFTCKQLSESAKLNLFGVTSAALYKVTISQTEELFEPNALVVVTSEYQPTISGTVKRVDYSASGVTTVYIDTSGVFPTEALSVV